MRTRDLKKFLKEKWHIVIFFIIFICTFVMVYIAAHNGEDYKFEMGGAKEFESQWTYELPDGKTGLIDLPGRINQDQEYFEVKLSNRLPIVTNETIIAFRAVHTNIKVYVDGYLRYDQLEEHEKNAVPVWYATEGVSYNEIPLCNSDSGKRIEIYVSGDQSRYVLGPGAVYVGDRGSFLLSIMQTRIYTIIGTIMLGVVAVVLFGVWLAMTLLTRDIYRETLCLFFFTFLVMCWLFTESRWAQFMFHNMRMFSVLSYNSLMLIAAPISMYFSYSMHEKVRLLSKVATAIPVSVWVIVNILEITNIAYYGETLLFVQAFCAVELFFLAYIQVKEIVLNKRAVKDGRLSEQFWKVPFVGLCLMFPLILIEIVIYAVPSLNSDNTTFLTAAIVIYIVSLALQSALKVTEDTYTANAANETKTQFLANMSHEIRTPLNAILGFNEIIMRDTTDPNIIEYSKSIQNAGESLKDIINSILDMSKIESGKMEIEAVGFSTQQLLDTTYDITAPLAEKKGLEFCLNIDPNLPAIIVGDIVRTRQILINLLNNGVKYTKRGHVELAVSLVSRNHEENSCKIKYSVIDTGIGIKDEERDALFARFERVNYQKNKNVEGTGLGMSIVSSLLEAMGSKIELFSIYGEGSEFYFVLEHKIIGETILGEYVPNSAKYNDENSSESEAFIAPEARILVVDDVALNSQVTKGLLSNLKMTIDSAESGMAALEMINNYRYDVIFMDHMMPEMDGIETTAAIRRMAVTSGDKYFEEVPVIALTANAITGMREMFLDAGMQDYVSKPVEGKQLIATLRKWLPPEKIVHANEADLNDSAQAQSESDSRWDVKLTDIDANEARKYVADFDAYLSSLRTYESAFEENVEKLNSYIENRIFADNTVVVHGLKSSSKIIGAMELSEQARVLEEMSKNQDEQVWENEQAFIDDYKDIVMTIRQYEKSLCGDDNSVLSAEELQEAIETIADAANNFDMDALLQWEIQYGTSEAEGEFEDNWNRLKRAVSNVSFSEILGIVDELNNTPL